MNIMKGGTHMCKYCEIYEKSESWEQNKNLLYKSLNLNKSPFMDIEVYISQGNKLIMYADHGNTCDSRFVVEKTIKYCPMCGRKLKADEEV